jgi:translin
MFKRADFARMRKEIERFDSLREQLIKESRSVLKNSKAAIYSVHRNNFNSAKQLLRLARQEINKVKMLIKKDANLAAVGAFSEALEEYVEAACYISFMIDKKIPTAKQLGVDTLVYLAGLCDLVGELVRKAITSVVKNDYKTAVQIHKFVSALHEELLLFNWRNIPVRRKFDSIKYGLEKLEDLMLRIKMKSRER